MLAISVVRLAISVVSVVRPAKSVLSLAISVVVYGYLLIKCFHDDFPNSKFLKWNCCLYVFKMKI